MTSTPVTGTTFFGLDTSNLSAQISNWRRLFSKRILLLDFHSGHLSLAEARLSGQGDMVIFDHIDQIDLPDDALERGVPKNPQAMADLIREICLEKKIAGHRCSVVLPPEVAFQKIICLPFGLSVEEARLHLLDPASGVQIPIPIMQTDFDLIPTSLKTEDEQWEYYLLLAIPTDISDQIIQVVSLANFDLIQMEIGSFSLLRLAAASLNSLGPYEVHGILDLSADSTQLTLCSSKCPLQTERLASIRLFPNPTLDNEQFTKAHEELISAESVVIEDESYLPISELDLRVLNSEIDSSVNHFKESWPDFTLTSISLFGINSAHPVLVDLLQERLGVPVEARCPSLISSLSSLQFDEKLLVVRGLSRLIGLGCGIVSTGMNEMRDAQSLIVRNKSNNQLPHLGQNNDIFLSPIDDIDQEIPSHLVQNIPATDEYSVLSDNGLEESLNLSLEGVVKVEVKELKEEENVGEEEMLEEEWPSLSLESVEEDKELKEEENVGEEEMLEEEWPSLSLESVEEDKELKEEENVGEEEMLEEEWPSLSLESVEEDKELKEEENVGEEEMLEEEWPSLSLESVEEDKELKEEENVGEEEMLEEEWPSLSLEGVEEDKELKEEENVGEEEMLEEEWPSLSLESVEEDKELKEEENVGEEEMLEEEWPSLSLESLAVEQELKNQSKKDLRAKANLEKEKTTKGENLDSRKRYFARKFKSFRRASLF